MTKAYVLGRGLPMSLLGFVTMRQAIMKLVAASAFAGLLFAGVAMPVVAVVGVTTTGTVAGFNSIPSQLQTPPLPQQTVLMTADGQRLATLFYQDRIEVPITEISQVMQDAIVAIEDSRFYEHHGFDLRGTLRALVSNASGSAVQGGSTITQQYVKNILIASAKDDAEAAAATERSPARKLRELRYSLSVERSMSKKEILAGYLNIAYFGAGAYGIEAASRRYFSKSASQLTLPEASLLAGLVQRPYAYDPIAHPETAKWRRSIVLSRMADLGYISREKADEVAHQDVSEILNPTLNSNGCTTSFAAFFCDYVVHIVRSSPAFGNTLAERDAFLRKGGLTIVTTLDSVAQESAQAAVNKYIPPTDESKKGAAISMVQPGTGNVIAMAQNRTWGISGDGKTAYNYNVDRAMGGTIGMQSGSTFKTFVLAAAMEQGLPVGERMYAPGIGSFLGFKNCTDGAIFPEYTTRNAHEEGGIYDMRTATAKSINTYFVALEQRTGICRPAEIAEALGMRLGNGADLARVPSFVLGANEVVPLEMGAAYATCAAHGLHCEPRAILSITDRDGNHLPVPPQACNQVIKRKVADGVTSLLYTVIEGNIPGRTGGAMNIGRPAAGKTGTTNDSAAVWFAGYTPDLAAAVWVGDPRGGYKHPMEDITINGKHYKIVYGATLPGPIWKMSMNGALKGKPKTPFDLQLPSAITGVVDELYCPPLGPISPTVTPTPRSTSYIPECPVTYPSETTP